MAPNLAPPEAPPLNNYAARQVNGEAMTKLSIDRQTQQEASLISGVVPFCVWNFNPVPIATVKLGTKYEVPPALSPLGIKKTIHWNDSERIASSMVFREAKGFSRPISVNTEPGGDANNPTMQYGWKMVQPIELVRAHIRNSSRPGWLVADAFCGSGTTLLASAMEERVARCVELDPRYCDAIRRRWTRWAKEAGVDVGSGGLDG